MSVDTAGAIRITRVIKADPQAVWEAWTRPEHMERWACPAPEGVKAVETDLRVGGSFEIRMEVDGQAHTAFGTYKEVDPPRRLVYTWDWREESHAMGDTTVTVEFEPEGDGTRVVLLHEGFPAVEARDGHREGWTACLTHFEGLFG